MKNNLILLIFYLSINTAFTQNVIIDGHVYLEQQTNHSNIKIIFNRTLPVVFLDSVYTDSTGYFNKSIPSGIYNISFAKNQYISATFLNRILYSDSALADTTLELIGLSGSLSGILTAGVYKVGLDIDVKNGDSLIIQPGVFLQFKENTGLNIHGYLFAEGALGDSIIYTGYTSANWNGIRFYEDANITSSMKYSKIEKARRALKINVCTPQISNINFLKNVLAISTNASKIIIRDCLIQDNYVDLVNDTVTGCSGISVFYGDTVKIINCRILHNRAYINEYKTTTGGIESAMNILQLINCIIIQNDGNVGGVNFLSQVGGMEIYNSTISNNQGLFDGGIHNEGQVPLKIYNSIIANNTATRPSGVGGIKDSGHPPAQIWYNTFWNNSQNDYENGSTSFIKTIVTVNFNNDSCDVFSNIFIDPLFVNVMEDDFHLLPQSPSIDAGENSYVMTEVDLDNVLRIQDGNNDMDFNTDHGAYENSSFNNISEKDMNSIINIYPNPVSYEIHIQSKTIINNLEIFNLSGIIVYSKKLNGFEDKIICNNIAAGIYFLSINFSDHSTTRFKILKN